MSSTPLVRDERGIALVMTLLLALALSALVVGATAVSMNAGLIRRYSERLSAVDAAAVAGLEEARSRLNGTAGLYPADSGYVTLENNAVVRDASGTIIPGLLRSTWAGPSGVASGQFGVVGSIITSVVDANNVRVVRRMEVNQESFAKYAYFTDSEGSGICFGGGDNVFGPVHSNDDICLYSSGAWFHDLVRTAGSIVGAGYGTFDAGYQQSVQVIPMPTPAAVAKLATQAAYGSTSFPGFTTGGTGQARTRVEFVALDLNADGDSTDADEGFIRVYQATSGNEDYVVASRYATLDNSSNINCGDRFATNSSNTTTNHNSAHNNGTGGVYILVANHASTRRDDAANHSSLRCFLGGDPALTSNVFTVNTPGGVGSWLPWGGAVDARVTAAVGATEAGYLHPITRALNPNFRGVIYVGGKVVISGKVRSRVTLAASSDVIIGDNIKQATDPAVGSCDDILGIVAGGSIIVADNLLNAPVTRPNGNWTTARVGNVDEWVHAVLLTLNIFTVQNYSTGSTNYEDCQTTNWGRGCLQLTGGIIQQTRGAVGTTAGTGNLKRYSYNQCALTDPPPYFPTTGHFIRSRIFEINPVGFDVAAWFAAYQI